MTTIDKIKALISVEGLEHDTILNHFIEIAEKRIRLKCGLTAEDNIPDMLSYIVVDYSVMRFNRLRSEGFQEHTVEGESIVLPENEDDFAMFDSAINDWLNSDANVNGKGRVRFL